MIRNPHQHDPLTTPPPVAARAAWPEKLWLVAAGGGVAGGLVGTMLDVTAGIGRRVSESERPPTIGPGGLKLTPTEIQLIRALRREQALRDRLALNQGGVL